MPTLHWIGKEKVQTHHNDVPYRVLEKQYTYGKYGNAWDAGASPAVVGVNTDSPSSEGGVGEVYNNMIIHGDNLEALKALLPEYQGRVDCIYIDPPYNTGNEGWVYNDNVNDPHIRKWLGAVVGKEAEDLTRHDKWLCMMYPRLVLLQKLLSPTGAIFISIDDNEQANLKLICDEIFGAGNFVNNFMWLHGKGKKDRFSRTLQQYVIVYAKNRDLLPEWNDKSYTNYEFTNPDNDLKGKWFSGSLSFSESRSNPLHPNFYEITSPTGVVWKRQWQVSKNEMQQLIDNGDISWGNPISCDGVPRQKIRPTIIDIIPNNIIEACGTTKSAENDLFTIFGKSVFDYPKPTQLIEHLLQIAQLSPNALILDSFAGSGTTAHAVLNLNKQDGGHRRFILVEMCDYAETITAERVRRVIDGYGEGSKAVEGTGGSFAFYELGDTIYDPQTGLLNDYADTEQIRRYIWFSETNTPYHSPLESSTDDAGRVVPTLPTPSTPHPYLLGRKDGTNYYFYYRRDEETVLDRAFLNTFTPADQAEQYIIYADCCRLSRDFMLTHHITFKQIPRDIKKV